MRILELTMTVWAASVTPSCGLQTQSDNHTVRDSAGVQIVTMQNLPEVEWRLDPTDMVIGRDADGDDYQLLGVTSARLLGDGRLVLANGGTLEIRYYSSKGKFLSRVGTRGRGPGEFLALTWLGELPGDSVIAYDFRQIRFSVFDSTGTFVRSFRLESTDQAAFAQVIGRFADGTFLAQGFAETGEGPAEGMQRYPAPLFRYGADGSFVSGLGLFPGNDGFFRPSQGTFTYYEPLFPRYTYRLASERHLIIADNNAFEVRALSLDGRLVGIMRTEFGRTRVSSQEVDIARERRLNAVPIEERAALARALNEMPVPERFPAYGVVRASDGGGYWIRQYPVPSADEGRWYVVDSTGVMVATVVAPLGVDLKHITADRAVGIERDDDGVEYVRVFRVSRE